METNIIMLILIIVLLIEISGGVRIRQTAKYFFCQINRDGINLESGLYIILVVLITICLAYFIYYMSDCILSRMLIFMEKKKLGKTSM